MINRREFSKSLVAAGVASALYRPAFGLHPRGAAASTAPAPPQIPAFTGVYDGTVAIQGNQFINGEGQLIQLRGSNPGQFLFDLLRQLQPLPAMPALNPLPNGLPKFSVMAQNWRCNVSRIQINQANWLGGNWWDASGQQFNSDPANNYKSSLDSIIAATQAAGMYTILSLCWTSAGRCISTGEQWQSDADNSIAFWTSVATRYANNPSVIFESFNEPQQGNYLPSNTGNAWTGLMTVAGDGAYSFSYNTVGDASYTAVYPVGLSSITGTFTPGETLLQSAASVGIASWVDTAGLRMFIGNAAGTPACANGTLTGQTSGATCVVNNHALGWIFSTHQQNINAIRAAGAPNPILLSGQSFTDDLSQWLSTVASDNTPPAGFVGTWTPQIACAWHPYQCLGGISSATVLGGGAGYAVNDTITLPHSLQYTSAQITVLAQTGGVMSGCYASTPGTGYHIDQVIDLTPGSSTAGQILVTRVDTNGGILNCQVLNGGTGFALNQVVTVPATWLTNGGAITPTPSAMILKVTAVSGGAVTAVSVQSAGQMSYSLAPLSTTPIAQASTSGSGSGATFGLHFNQLDDTWTVPSNFPTVAAIAAHNPVVMTEFGGMGATSGNIGDPADALLMTFAETNGIHYTPWAWQNGITPYLITNNTTGAPTDGYGQWFQAHQIRKYGTPRISVPFPTYASSGTAGYGNNTNDDQQWTATALPATLAYDISGRKPFQIGNSIVSWWTP